MRWCVEIEQVFPVDTKRCGRRLAYRRRCQGRRYVRRTQKDLGPAHLPGGVGCRGGHGGEAARAEMYWSVSNRSPELHPRTVSSGWGRSHRSEMQTRTRVCQGDARDQGKKVCTEKRSRGGGFSPESSPTAVGLYEIRNLHARSLVALGFRKSRGSREGVEGFI
jgi:hypothetical protein